MKRLKEIIYLFYYKWIKGKCRHLCCKCVFKYKYNCIDDILLNRKG